MFINKGFPQITRDKVINFIDKVGHFLQKAAKFRILRTCRNTLSLFKNNTWNSQRSKSMKKGKKSRNTVIMMKMLTVTTQVSLVG